MTGVEIISGLTIVIALLDKGWPPQHSFVDGMLARALGGESDVRVRLCVSRVRKRDTRARRYFSACCLPVFHQRRRFGRVRNFWIALRAIRYQAARERARGNRVVVFVRNEPVYLLAATLVRGRVDRLVFQSSFPHEEYSGGAIKRWGGRMLYRFGSRGVDSITAVSPEGLERVQRLFPKAHKGPYIPLLADMVIPSCAHFGRAEKDSDVRFFYAGTHQAGRQLEVVLSGIVEAMRHGAKGRFRFVGASEPDRRRLFLVPGVSPLVEEGVLEILAPVPRDQIPSMMIGMDVGISLIPPKRIYFESSPTKLAEYMGAGLAVLASKGIPMQERFVREAKGGALVDWEVGAIAKGILALCSDRAQLVGYRENARCYANAHMQYGSYLSDFRKLLGCE